MMKIHLAMLRFFSLLLPIIILNCSESPIRENLDHSLLQIKTLTLNNINIDNYWVAPNLGSNERLYLGSKNNINIPMSFVQMVDAEYLNFYNDSAITIDSIRFMMCSIDSSLEEVLPNLYFSPDSEFNENESIYSEFISFSEDGLLYLDNPEIDTKYDTNSIYSHTELLWNVDTLIDIFSDTLDTDPLNSFVLFPQNTNSTLIELFSEEATDGEKDPQLIIYYTRTTYISDDSIVVDTNKSKIYSNGDLSIIDPSGVIYDTGQVGLCNGTGMRSIINIPKVEDSIPNGSLIRTANLMIPYDTNRTNISMAKLQNITIDLLTSDSINIDSMLFSNTTFEADPFSGIGYPYRVENDADTTIINNGIYRVSMKNIIQSKVLGDNISSSLKLVSNEKNNPFEHVWLSNMENDIIKIEILYVKN